MSEIPQSIGRYRILRLLGSGAMGDVYLAEDPNIDRQLAIKTVRVLGGTPEDIAERSQRLLREAKAAGRLLHPNVVTLYDADEADGVLYLAFEYVPGTDAARRAVAQPPLTLGEVLRLVREVASALEYAHRQGIVHRDIKPSNILLGSEGQAKVADFGIAKLGESTQLTRTGSVVGSPQYMSPEQVRGETLDGRSDLFSLGVVLYELLAGARPFAGETLSTLVFEILSKDPLPLASLRPELSPGLIDLTRRLLAKDRNERPADAAALRVELEALERSLPPALLAAPAATDPSSSAPTRHMPSSASAPPPPPPAAPTPRAPVPPPPPTAQPPTAPPPTPQGHSQAGHGYHGQVAAPQAVPGSVERPSPIPSGTYSGPKMGKGLATVAVLGVLAALVAVGGWLALKLFMGDGGKAPAETQVAGTTGEAQDRANTAPDNAPAEPSPGDGAPAPTVDLEGTAEDGSAPPSSGDLAAPRPTEDGLDGGRQTVQATPVQTTPPRAAPEQTVPARTAPVRREPPPGAAPPAVQTPPVRAPASPPRTAPEPETDPAPAEPTRQSPQLSRFDEAAQGAHAVIRSGRRLQLKIRPDDAIVRILARGDRRGIVQGRAAEFDPSEDDSRVLELPHDGDFLIHLVHDSYPGVRILVHADAATSSSPKLVSLSLAEASRRGAASEDSGPRTLRVSRSLSFDVEPPDAEVWLDGERIGIARDWPGHRRARNSANLQLESGRHEIRLKAEGYEEQVIRVVVERSAPNTRPLRLRLRRSSD
ncbi:MAG: protein kinase [Acidobacteriota bacterium]